MYWKKVLATKKNLKPTYRKFIILGRSRTGSNFIMSLLKSHSNIKIFGEIFNKDIQTKDNWKSISHSPVRYLEKKVFQEYESSILAVGFKMFYYHAQDYENTIWQYLKNEKVQIIHIKRKNILKTIVSRELAIKTKQWTLTNEEEKKETKIHLSYQKCLNEFKRTKKNEKKYDFFFKNNKLLEVFYEDLCLDKNKEVRRILKFLGLKQHRLSSQLKKQNTRKLSEVIDNYYELKKKIEDTKWIKFFED